MPVEQRAPTSGALFEDGEVKVIGDEPDKHRTTKSKTAKGYRREQFEEAWRLYCAEDGTPAQPSNIRSLRPVGAGTRDGT